MTTQPHTLGPTDELRRASIEPARRHIRPLLACGVAAGPLFVGSTLIQAATREGFDMRRHAASLLSNGDLGWIQTLTFVLTGALVTAAAIGLGRALRTRAAGQWGPRLLVVYGLSFLAAGVFPADPTLGFPAGTPEGAGPITASGVGHMVSGLLGFLAVIVGSALLARTQLRAGHTRRGLLSAATASGFLLAVVGIMSGSGSASASVTLGFWVAIACSFAWLASTCRWAGRTTSDSR